jgi:hypothetical protein
MVTAPISITPLRLAGLHRFVEAGRQVQQPGEHPVADVGHHALADPGDEVVARRTRHREQADDRHHHGEVLVHQRKVVAGEAVIDDPPHRHRHRQRGPGREQQEKQRRRHLRLVAGDMGEEVEQRRQIARTRAVRLLAALGLDGGLRSSHGVRFIFCRSPGQAATAPIRLHAAKRSCREPRSRETVLKSGRKGHDR